MGDRAPHSGAKPGCLPSSPPFEPGLVVPGIVVRHLDWKGHGTVIIFKQLDSLGTQSDECTKKPQVFKLVSELS